MAAKQNRDWSLRSRKSSTASGVTQSTEFPHSLRIMCDITSLYVTNTPQSHCYLKIVSPAQPASQPPPTWTSADEYLLTR